MNDNEVLRLADYAMKVENHYSTHVGHPMPMDIEWAKDADDGELYVIQARPETVALRARADGVHHLFAQGNRPRVGDWARGRRKNRDRDSASCYRRP